MFGGVGNFCFDSDIEQVVFNGEGKLDFDRVICGNGVEFEGVFFCFGGLC